MYTTPNLLTTPATLTLVRDDGAHYTASGMRVPPEDIRSREITEQAVRWLALAEDRTRMRRPTLVAKALSAVAFSVRHGARSLAVPSKLSGTSGRQRALWTMVREHVSPWTELSLDDTGGGLAVRYGDDVLGEVQPKHLGWARPLVPFGLKLYFCRVTGHDYDAYTLGCNVVFGYVGQALDRLLDALGEGALRGPVRLAVSAGDSGVTSGDGASTEAVPAPSEATPAGAGSRGGDGA